jgi:sec-independent protein translocase protein TatA
MFESIVLFGLGMQEILVIALIVLLLFGGKKIPELMKGLGKGVKSFKEGMNEVTDMSQESGDRSQESGDRSQESGDKKDE